MKKLVLFIGYHKTGSTFINKNFLSMMPEIRHLGKPYEFDNPVREFIERMFGYREYDETRCRHIYTENIENIRKKSIVTISDGRIIAQRFIEDLRTVPDRLYKIVNDVKVVIIIRHQIEWIKSYYVQLLSTERVHRDINQWILDNWEKKFQLKSVTNYASRIIPYIEVFGKENVGVFLYEKLSANPKDFEKDLCSFIGVDWKKLPKPVEEAKPLNTRITNLHLFFKRYPFIFKVISKNKGIIPISVREKVTKIFDRYEPKLSDKSIELVTRNVSVSNNSLLEITGLPLAEYQYPLS